MAKRIDREIKTVGIIMGLINAVIAVRNYLNMPPRKFSDAHSGRANRCVPNV